MADDAKKRGAEVRRRVAGRQEHEVAFIMKLGKVSKEEALRLIQKHNGDLDNVMSELAARPVR